MRRALTLTLALALAPAIAACGGEDRTPEGAARLFLRAIDEGNSTEVYRLLAPSTQEALGKLLQLAGAQAGGGRRFKPEELLAVGQDPGHSEVSEVLVASVDGDRARVRLISAKKKAQDSMELVRVGGVWRVLLPPRVTAPLAAPASAPASRPRPASAPSP